MTAFVRQSISDLVEVRPRRHGDSRGWFMETFSASAFAAEGLPVEWVQDNHSMSARRGTLRGLHFQALPAAQHKLVRVLGGAIFDVAVDIRAGSPSFGRWVGVELSSDTGNQLFVPVGFAHGFLTLTDDVEVAYKVSAPYAPQAEGAIRWDDPDLAITWPDIGEGPHLSAKDQVAPNFADHQPVF